ncbi:MAG TPA: hypothetical protein VGL23_11255 [Chloroflexota bacterium]|jgi:hypothetical protein
MTPFAQTPEREDAPASRTRVDEFAHLSREDLQRCLGATEIARRVARDRGDARVVADLTARHLRLSKALAGRR